MVSAYQDDMVNLNRICVVTNAGSLNEPTINKGIAHILEHVLLLGLEEINSKKFGIKGYVDFAEMVIMIETNDCIESSSKQIFDCLDCIFDEQNITRVRIVKAKLQIILEKIHEFKHSQEQKKILRKLYKSRLLEMPIGNFLKIIFATQKEILAFYEEYFLIERAHFIVFGKNADVLQIKLNNYIKRKGVIVKEKEIYIPLERRVSQKLINDDVLKTFLFLSLESYFYELYQQDIHIEILNIGLKKTFLVFVNNTSIDQRVILKMIKEIKHHDISDDILDIAKDIFMSYRGKIFDSDLIVNALIDISLGRSNAFFINDINYEKINWKKVFINTRILMKEIFQNNYFGR